MEARIFFDGAGASTKTGSLAAAEEEEVEEVEETRDLDDVTSSGVMSFKNAGFGGTGG